MLQLNFLDFQGFSLVRGNSTRHGMQHGLTPALTGVKVRRQRGGEMMEEFLKGRIAALKSRIAQHRRDIELCETMPSTDPDENAAEMAEAKRRLDIDQTLLDKREAQIKALG